MTIITEALRQFWIPGLNDITGQTTKGLAEWILDEEFQFYDPVQPDSFSLSVADDKLLLMALAFDCNRMSISSFETVSSIVPHKAFPKSTAWLIVKSYYSAFFAAHSVLRLFGVSCSQLSQRHSSSIYKIADSYGQLNGNRIASGFYVCKYDASHKKLRCEKLNNGSSGVHESFWHYFNGQLNEISNELLMRGGNPAWNQQVSVKLTELCGLLSQNQVNNGSWLSFIRNEVNYRHQLGTWYPYRYSSNINTKLFNNCEEWKQDPMTIDLRRQGGLELCSFQNACNFLISLCRELVCDMSERCSTGKSFHHFGSIAFLNLLNR